MHTHSKRCLLKKNVVMEKKTLKLVTQVSDIDIIENEGESAYMAEVSDDERSSIDSYIFGKHFRSTPDFLEEAELPSFR